MMCPVVGAAAAVRRNPLPFEKDLDGLRPSAAPRPRWREAVRDTLKEGVGLDVAIDANAAHTSFGKAIGLGRQGLKVRPVEVFRARRGG